MSGWLFVADRAGFTMNFRDMGNQVNASLEVHGAIPPVVVDRSTVTALLFALASMLIALLQVGRTTVEPLRVN